VSKARDIADSAVTINALDGVTATGTELNILDGVTATTAELNYVDGVTSSVQTQLDGKATYPTQTGNSGKFLTTDGTNTSWAAIETGTITATADGALTNGCPVVVNSDGTVSKTLRNQQTEASGSQTTIINITPSGNNNTISSAYVPDHEDAYLFVSEQGDNDGYLRRVNVTGTTISGGPSNIVPATGSETRWGQMAYIGNSKVVLCYRGDGDGNAGKMIIASVASDGTATFGTEVEFTPEVGASSVAYDSDNDKIIVVYGDADDSYNGKIRVCSFSGTTITLGSAVAIQNGDNIGTTFEVKAKYIPEQELIVFCYMPNSSNNMYLQSYSCDGTSVTAVDRVTVSTDNSEYMDLSYATHSGELVVAWTAQGDSDNGKAKNYSFSAVDKSFSNIDFLEWTNGAVNGVELTYDPNAQHWYMIYWNLSNSSYPERRYLKSTSGTLSTTDTTVLVSQNTNKTGLFYHAAEASHVIIFTEWGLAHQIGYDITNLTSDNYIGISDAAYSDGATATVQIVGAVDDAQTGLTAGSPAYVQRDGTIGTSADTPSVVAGTAISATEIIVKG